MPNILKNPKGAYAEAFRTVKTNIRYSSTDKDKKVFLVTSTQPGEGKSTVAVNLAMSLSLDNKKVIIIDADLRKPTVHKRLQISGTTGLTDVLVGEAELDDTIIKVNEYLNVLVAGQIPPNPAELLASKGMEKLINKFREEYDYVILDGNPICVIADSQILASKVDGVILIARHEYTKKDELVNAKKLVEQVGGHVIGVILNRVRDKSKRYYYYY
ncbi:CpsD/CapB family tyrosine-protein kinase [Clostridium sp. MSJ-8]|uniref:CpsD/CapB family tyrosine-protein kinase n=1 Tax=Clostridium sp. MSJ-8 TaxID=2841510 RepID=UPI001C0EE016|nr:CpsD/CapB family tyrosine-protein kinase [Clostridium sp. MSJ-8]MBU5488064.1 CpsD/CapB family tyrosine-protein kinase [Clostridium sp. MSJ-8]